jgi:hypothetical protein
VAIELRDRLPAESWQQSPLARELGRVLALTGTRTADGIEGTVTETITGLRAAPVQLKGAFALRREGPLTGIVHAPDFVPKDAAAPTWLAPPGLDPEACATASAPPTAPRDAPRARTRLRRLQGQTARRTT